MKPPNFVSEDSYLRDRDYILGTLDGIRSDVSEIKTAIAADQAVKAASAARVAAWGARTWAVVAALTGSLASIITVLIH